MQLTSTLNAPLCTQRPSFFRRFLAALVAADGAYRQRVALKNMSAEQLRDIGLTADDVRTLEQPKWDAPTVMLR